MKKETENCEKCGMPAGQKNYLTCGNCPELSGEEIGTVEKGNEKGEKNFEIK